MKINLKKAAPEPTPEASAEAQAAAGAAQTASANTAGASANTAGTAAQSTPEPQSIDEVTQKLMDQNAELLNDLQRTRADFENFRKQVEIQREQARQNGAESTILKLIPLLDDMSRAFASEPKALAPVKKSLDKALSELKLERIDANEGTDFNPDFHEAISMDAGDGAREVVAEELRPGYLYEGNVIRAAMVRVKKVD